MKDWEILVILAGLLMERIPDLDPLSAIELAYVVLESVVDITNDKLKS